MINIQTIQNDIYNLLDDLIIYENNKISRDFIKYQFYTFLNNHKYNNINKIKVTCDNSNNIFDIDKFIYIDLYIYMPDNSCSTIMSFVIKIDGITKLRKLRKNKLTEIYK